MYSYVYLCKYVCMYVCIYMYVCMHVSIFINIYMFTDGELTDGVCMYHAWSKMPSRLRSCGRRVHGVLAKEI